MPQFIKRFRSKLPVNFYDIPKQGDIRPIEFELQLRIKGFVKIIKCEKMIYPIRKNLPVGARCLHDKDKKRDLSGPVFLIMCDHSAGIFNLKFVLRQTNQNYKNFDNLIYLENWTEGTMVFLKTPSYQSTF